MRIVFDVIIACLALIVVLIAIYLAILQWTDAARAEQPMACQAYPSECTAVMQGQF